MAELLSLVPQISSGFALLALVVAVGFLAFGRYLKHLNERLSKSASDNTVDLLKGVGWYLHIDANAMAKLEPQQISDLAQRTIASRLTIQKYIVLVCLVIFLAFLATAIVVTVVHSIGVDAKVVGRDTAVSSDCDDDLREGDLRYSKQHWTIAEDTYRDALQRCPNDWRLYNGLGHVHFATAAYSTAASDYRKASELNPDNPHIFHALGYALMGTQDFGAAIANFEQAREMLGDDSGTGKQMLSSAGQAYLYRSMGSAGKNEADLRQAISYFDRFLETRPLIDYWIRYYKACAVAELHGALRANDANTILKEALDSLSRSTSERRDLHMGFMRSVLSQDPNYRPCPTCPIVCPGLLQTVEQSTIADWLSN